MVRFSQFSFNSNLLFSSSEHNRLDSEEIRFHSDKPSPFHFASDLLSAIKLSSLPSWPALQWVRSMKCWCQLFNIDKS
jgi:hypothetical protein